MPVRAQAPFIVLASTTSTQDSGLFEYILPLFKARTGVEVRVVALGTGQALDVGRRGDADVVFVHDAAAELAFVAQGFGIERRQVMYNDFILVGPAADPARVRGSKDITAALKAIAANVAPFASRGDRSGTHAAERRLWQRAGIEIDRTKGTWYRETGQGMGPTLNIAAAMPAYALTDRGTWLGFKNRQELVVAVEGDQTLYNQYSVMLVNPERHPHVKQALGQAFIAWITGPDGQRAIADYKVGGQPLFFPNYAKPAG
ncbi:MAG: tungsten ABC transporter substrate-binding protein [Alphaproteobacteria bacterium]|nr:tungsten ABC transporter substrate-binding protein [Alphaproteobacteria bacterium]